MTIGFAALAAGGVTVGDALVAAVAAIGASVSLVLAVLAPRLAAWTQTPQSQGYEEQAP
jgi:hypothetical protein